ncbi:hypothetical protein FACS18948_6920 [Clostridia bacterium]|nr:hypothetical protein FACS18948_6920 [Clostridia bacterium]
MNTFNLREIADQSLRMLEQSGASAKTIKGYRCTGFGAALRYFAGQGVSVVSSEMLDAYVLVQRELFENGAFSEYKWWLIRRGSELLKHFHAHGELGLPSCVQWNVIHNRLRREPSTEEFADKNNIYSLVWNAKRELERANYSTRTLEHYYREGFDQILRYFAVEGRSDYSDELISEILVQSEKACTWRKSEFYTLRRAAILLKEFYDTGELASCHIHRFEVRENLENAEDLNMRELMTLALKLLEGEGLSAKTLKEYRVTGFGTIIRHFEAIGQPKFSAGIIDEIVLQTRHLYESAQISKGTWRCVRRGGELLKHLQTQGNLDIPSLICDPRVITLPMLPKWEFLHNPLHCKPSDKALADPDNIYGLVWRTKQAMQNVGYSNKALATITYDGFGRILRKHKEAGIIRYSPKLLDETVEAAHMDRKAGKIGRSTFQDIRKAAEMAAQFYKTGMVVRGYLPRYGLRQLNDYFSELMADFLAEMELTGRIKPSTLSVTRSPIRGFLFELEDNGFLSFESITLRVVSERITHFALRFKGGRQSMLFAVRIFLKHLYSNKITDIDLSTAIPEFAAWRKPIREGFSNEVIDKLLAAVNTATAIGKRDYAIMLLATQTGFRGCDIVNLKRQNIDWRAHKIRIIQQKTGRPLTLHLPTESGNAISDYLLNARPEGGEPFIFLSNDTQRRPLKGAHPIVARLRIRAGVEDSVSERSGFHSFRRSFGKRLLEAEVSSDILSELLGHDDPDSAKTYMAIDESGLKDCALSLAAVRKAGEVE